MPLILTIELVPQTCWYSNVRSEVSKDVWDLIRKQVYQEVDYKCEICGDKGPRWPVECHEAWHYDDDDNVQTLTKMLGLCPSCHEVKHIGRAHAVGNGERATRHLMKVNEWSRDEADEYIRDQFRIWTLRSESEWRLDLTYLRNYGVRDSDLKNGMIVDNR